MKKESFFFIEFLLQQTEKEAFSEKRPAYSLYIHWPFCLSKCPYCDFNSHVVKDLNTDTFGQGLLTELKTLLQRLPKHTPLQSIFFGGGTPSLMPPALVRNLIAEATSYFYPLKDLEITLEANPTTFEEQRFKDFHDAGINRLSLGIQSFNNNVLAFLGRTHSSKEAMNALEATRGIFRRYSFDLMYGLPDQGPEDWEKELQKAVLFKPRHLSCYQLTYEPGTAFHTRFQRGEFTYPPEKEEIAFAQRTEDLLASQGLERYEVSNYAAPGEESVHNLAYWRSWPTIGIGPGAHGRPFLQQKKMAEKTFRAPYRWLAAVKDHGHGLQESRCLSAQEVIEEKLLMGLRLKEGVTLQLSRNKKLASINKKCLELKKHDLMTMHQFSVSEVQIRATNKGRLILNQVLKYLLADG